MQSKHYLSARLLLKQNFKNPHFSPVSVIFLSITAPITADAATTKVLGAGKTFTVKKTTSVSGLSKAEKKIVSVSINKKKRTVTVKGLKPGKATFKVGKKSYTVKVGAVKIKKKDFETTLTAKKNKTVSVIASYGANDTLAWTSSKKSVVKVSKATTKASSKKIATNVLKPLDAGSATITVKSKNTGKKLSIKVKVKAAVTPTATPSTAPTATGGAVTTPSVEPTATTTATTNPTVVPTGDAVTATPEVTTGSATANPSEVPSGTPEVTTGSATANPSEVPSGTPEVTTGSATTAPIATPEVTTDGTITVTTNVTGASIEVISGTAVVATGSSATASVTTKELENGTYTVKVSKDGYRTETTSVVVSKATNTVEVKLVELIASAKNVTESVLTEDNAADFALKMEYYGATGEKIAAADLPSDLTVTYTDNKGIFAANGTINTTDAAKAALKAAKGADITVVATVTSASDKISTSKEFKLKVVEATDWSGVTSADLLGSNGEKLSVAVVGEAVKVIPTVATQFKGTVVSGTAIAALDTNYWNSQVASVKSSDVTKLVVNATDENNVVLTPISAGDVTITVTLDNGAEFTKVITVKSAARTANTIKSATSKVELSDKSNSENVSVVVTDQYGDPVFGATVYAVPTKTDSSAVVQTASSAVATDEEGKTTLTLTSVAGAKAGNDTVKLATVVAPTADQVLGNIDVSYAVAGQTASYALKVVPSAGTSDNAELDLYNTNDSSVLLQFIGKDANGIVSAEFTSGQVGTADKTYIASSSDTNVATVTMDGNNIKVTGKGTGTATIYVKEGNIVRASYVVTVKDGTPSIASFTVASNIHIGSSTSSGVESTVKVDADILNTLVSIKGNNSSTKFTYSYNSTDKVFDVKDGENVIAKLQLFTSSNSSKIVVDSADGKTIKNVGLTASDIDVSVIAKLTKADTNKTEIGTVAIPVEVDTTAPTCKLDTTNSGTTKVAITPSEFVKIDITGGSTNWNAFNGTKDGYEIHIKTGENVVDSDCTEFTITDMAGNKANYVARYTTANGWKVLTELADAQATAIAAYDPAEYTYNDTEFGEAYKAYCDAVNACTEASKVSNVDKSNIDAIDDDATVLGNIVSGISSVSGSDLSEVKFAVDSELSSYVAGKYTITYIEDDNGNPSKVTIGVKVGNAENTNAKVVTY